MGGLTKDQWKVILIGTVVSVLVGDTLRQIISAVWHLHWMEYLVALKEPNLQMWIAQVVVPVVLVGGFARRHGLHMRNFESIANLWLCGMSIGVLSVFVMNLPNPRLDSFVAEMRQDPLTVFPYFSIAIFYLMFSLIQTIRTNDLGDPVA